MQSDKINNDVNTAFQQIKDARANINKGLRMLLFGITRLFVEAWIVQEIWNWVVVGHTDATAVTYWESFAGMILVRILLGQIKIGGVTLNNDNNKQTKK